MSAFDVPEVITFSEDLVAIAPVVLLLTMICTLNDLSV
jgi:hypothetical protein